MAKCKHKFIYARAETEIIDKTQDVKEYDAFYCEKCLFKKRIKMNEFIFK